VKRSLWRLLKLAWPFKWRMMLAALLGFATVGSGIGLMATSAFIIAAAALHPSIADLQVAIVGVRFFGISRGVFRYLERYVSHNVTFRLLAKLRVWFYALLEPLAPARLMAYRSGDLLSRVVADIETLEHFYVRVIAPLAVALLTAGAMWVFMASYALQLAYLLLAFLLLVGVGVPALAQALSRGVGPRVVRERSALNEALVDGVQGMADLLTYGQAGQQVASVSATSRRLIAGQKKMAWASGLHNALGILLSNLGMIAVLVVAIPMVRAGRFSGVQLAVLALAALSAFEAVLPLPLAAQFLENNVAAADRLFEIVDATPAVEDPPRPLLQPQTYDLQIAGLRFRYPSEPTGAQPALDDVSFRLPAGGRLAVVGPSGAGKSTLVNLLLRFWDYQEGQILLGGRELKQFRGEDVRRLIGVVSQHTYLFNDTVRANLLLGRPDATEDEMIAAARQAQIHDFIVSLPAGYDTWVGEQGVRLSGGERQRIAIARALLKDAPLLILDEATANLDALTERAVLQAIYALMESRTTLIVTHRLVGLDHADEILVLQAGRVVERGTQDALLRREGVYRRMWDLQRQSLP